MTWPLCFVSIFSWSYDSLIAKGWPTHVTVKESKKRKWSLLPGLSTIRQRKTFLSISDAFHSLMTYVTHVLGGVLLLCSTSLFFSNAWHPPHIWVPHLFFKCFPVEIIFVLFVSYGRALERLSSCNSDVSLLRNCQPTAILTIWL